MDRERGRYGSFLLTGSQPLGLMKSVSDSLAGAAVIALEPLSFADAKADRDFLLLAAPRGPGERLTDVVALEIRAGGQHLVGVMACGQKSDDGPAGDAKPPNARASADDVGILRDSMQPGHRRQHGP